MDQDATRYGSRRSLDQPRPHCIRLGPSSPMKRDTAAPPPHFSAHVCCSQRAGWIKMPVGTEVGLGQTKNCVRWGPSSPPATKGLGQKLYYMGTQLSPRPRKGNSSPHFSAKRLPSSATTELLLYLRRPDTKLYSRCVVINGYFVNIICRAVVVHGKHCSAY